MSAVMPKYGENRPVMDGKYDKSLAVKCINGTFVGQKQENVLSFKGIPYVGAQPVGDLRWKAPVDVMPCDGVYEAFYYGKSPVQSPGDPAALYPMGEDCLSLNIWKAEGPAAGRPVMVWIYGGAFDVGGTTDPQYDCVNLVKENPDIVPLAAVTEMSVTEEPYKEGEGVDIFFEAVLENEELNTVRLRVNEFPGMTKDDEEYPKVCDTALAYLDALADKEVFEEVEE